jgi:hypothetical protein
MTGFTQGVDVMRKSFLLISLAVAVALAAGCGTTAPGKLADLPKAAQLKQAREGPLRYRVAFPPIMSAQEQKPKSVFAAAVEADTASMRNELAKTLRDFQVFDELLAIEAANGTEALEVAKKEGVDLLLETSLVRYNVAYDRGARGAGAVIAWLFSPWLSWLVGDEVYTADIGLNMALKQTSDGSILWQKEVTGKASCELSDLQRGLKTHEYFVGSIFTGPASFNKDNYQKAAAVVGPHAMQNLQLNMVDEMYQLSQPPPDKKSFAIVIGVNAARFGLLPKLKYAEADAVEFAKAIKKYSSQYSDNNVKLLTGKVATIAGLRAAVMEITAVEHTDIIDLLVYFAGPGASVGGKHNLAFHLTEDQNTMLSLEELYSLVEGVQAKNRIIVLDTGFAGESSRGLVLSGGQLTTFKKTIAGSRTVTIISSCGPNQGGHEFKELGHGVFTSKLLERLAGKSLIDINRDKSVTAEEIVTDLDWRVQRFVRDNTVGQSQEPALVGDKKLAGSVIFRLK